MNIKMDEHDAQYKPQVYQSRSRGQNRHEYRQNSYQPRNRSYSKDRNAYRGRGNIGRNYKSILEVDHETFTVNMVGETITGKMIGEIVTDKIIEEVTIEVTICKIMDEIIIEKKGIEIGVQVEVGIVTEVITEIIQGKDLSEVEILVEIGIRKDSHNHDLEEKQKIEEIVVDQDKSQSLDLVQE